LSAAVGSAGVVLLIVLDGGRKRVA
jgi:hypothetical protein